MRACAGALLVISGLHAADARNYGDHVGIYVWGKLAGGLESAVADLKRLGADRVARVYIGPGALWDPADTTDNSPIDVKVRRPDYRAFLGAFPVVMFTAYDSASYRLYKRQRLDSAHLAATRDEFRRFALEVAKTPGRRIISNWEFENDCTPPHWAACQEYYQARLDGISDGRTQAKRLGYPGEILTAFEFIIVPGYTGRPSGLVDVGARLRDVDFFSYSSWASIGWDFDAATMFKSFDWGIHVLREFLNQKKLTSRLIIGEFGEYWDLHPTSERMKALVDACISGGVEYLFDWVLYDQPGKTDDHGRDASHFGKYTLKRTLTPQGKAFQSWFRQSRNP